MNNEMSSLSRHNGNGGANMKKKRKVDDSTGCNTKNSIVSGTRDREVKRRKGEPSKMWWSVEPDSDSPGGGDRTENNEATNKAVSSTNMSSKVKERLARWRAKQELKTVNSIAAAEAD